MNSNPFIKIHAIRLAIIYPDADLGGIQPFFFFNLVTKE